MYRTISIIMAAAALTVSGIAQADTTIRLETYAGPRHAMNTNGWPAWIKDLTKASGGKVKVRMTYPPINPRVLYDRVRDGIADMAWITHGYTTGRFVLTQMIELPGADGNAEQMSRAFWRTYTGRFGKRDEHKGVQLVALFTHGPGLVHSRGPIANIGQVKGMKVRTGGGVQSQIAKRLGIVSVSAPVTKAQEILQQGVADGIFFSIETIYSFKLGGVVKHHYALPGGLYSASFAVVMNQRKYDSLNAADKASLKKVGGEHMSGIMGRTWDGADSLAVEKLTAAGNKVGTFDAATAKAVKAKLAGLDDWWIKRAVAEGAKDAADVLKALRAEVQKVKKGM